MELGKEYFGPLWKYIANEEITDVDYNGREIWLTNIYNETLPGESGVCG